MASSNRSQQTEKPTPRRIQKAQEKGQVARSAEIPGVMVLAGFLVFCRTFGPSWLDRLRSIVAGGLGSLVRPDLTPDSALVLARTTFGGTLMLLVAPLGMLAAAGIAGNVLQGPPPLTLEPLKPSFAKLNPVTNLQRIVSLKQLVEILKIILKLALYGTVAWTAAHDAVFLESSGAPGAEGTLSRLLSLGGTVILRVTILAAFLAALDFLFRRWDHTRSLMMTKQEVREERKELEGDPLIRARIRSKQLALARTRMMSEVPKATVVVTNPTHVAVALRYAAGEADVPKVVAKGRGKIAQRIREIAAEAGVPIISDPPLARSLYKSVPLGAEIHPTLFRAVAEVLALVLRPRARRVGATPNHEVAP